MRNAGQRVRRGPFSSAGRKVFRPRGKTAVDRAILSGPARAVCSCPVQKVREAATSPQIFSWARNVENTLLKLQPKVDEAKRLLERDKAGQGSVGQRFLRSLRDDLLQAERDVARQLRELDRLAPKPTPSPAAGATGQIQPTKPPIPENDLKKLHQELGRARRLIDAALTENKKSPAGRDPK